MIVSLRLDAADRWLALALVLALSPALSLCAQPSLPPDAQKPPDEQPTADEQKALDQLAAEIQGEILYTRYTAAMSGQQRGRFDGRNDPKNWVVEKVAIGQWKPVTLGEGRFASWSPDGKQIVVFSWPDAAQEGKLPNPQVGCIAVMNADGSDRRTLAEDAFSNAYDLPMCWHPNGKEIVYVRCVDNGRMGNGLWAVNVDTGAKHEFLPKLNNPQEHQPVSEPQISVDGKFLAARAGESSASKKNPLGNLVVVNVAKQTAEVYGTGCCAAISPDGNWMSNNFDSHNRMVLHHRDGAQKIFADIKNMTAADRGKNQPPAAKDCTWDNPRWSNNNDYLTAKNDNRSRAVYVFRVSEKRWTRVVFAGGHCDYPQLLVAKDLLPQRKPLTGDAIP